jgi:hypothetical protein
VLEEEGAGMTTVGVCGHGRCGSSMLMAMLDAGGLPPVPGSAPGSYELPNLFAETLGAVPLDGYAIKLLDSVLYDPLPTADWRFIWLSRDYRQQARSQIKFLRWVMPELSLASGTSVSCLVRSYERDTPKALKLLRALGPVQVIRYEDVLASPYTWAREMAERLDLPLDLDAMAGAVHRRSARCRGDMSVEESQSVTP